MHGTLIISTKNNSVIFNKQMDFMANTEQLKLMVRFLIGTHNIKQEDIVSITFQPEPVRIEL